jgi:small subunit ribosomal protein S16
LLRIRLTRVGKKKKPAYRIVVADSRAPRDGAFLRIIGHYNPLTSPATLVVKEDEAVHWLQKGAQPSETAAKLLTRAGVMEKAGRAPVRYEGKQAPPGKRPRKGAEPAPPAAAPAAAAAAEAPPAEEPVAGEEPAPLEPAAEEAAEAPAAGEPEAAAGDATADEETRATE